MAIKIDIYSDVVCPWCYLGKRRLEQVIAASPPKPDLEINYLPYELNPATPARGVNRKEYLQNKYGNSIDGAHERLVQMGEEAGIDYRFDDIEKIPNTFNAHRIIWLAGKEGNQAEVVDALFKAYFSQGKDLGDNNTLSRIAETAGLDASKVEKLLAGSQGTEEVREMEEKAYNLGITGVPFFVFNGQFAVSGAQSKETFVSALKQAAV
jgi:predicted DsbA family dithiol-disulfide isomerase